MIAVRFNRQITRVNQTVIWPLDHTHRDVDPGKPSEWALVDWTQIAELVSAVVDSLGS